MVRSSPAPRHPIRLAVPRFQQPDDLTCGPTCLTQVYRYFGHPKPLEEVIAETPRNPDGGTLGVSLGTAALRNGFRATVYSYNLRVFDPTWHDLAPEALVRKLRRRRRAVHSARLRRTLLAYETYLAHGGRVRFEDLERRLLVRILQARTPILTGLSATYLYRTPREHRDRWDDIRGEPVGHFVVICGYYPKSDRFVVRDPSTDAPFSRSGRYSVPAERLIASILLGERTYDAMLLVLTPR